MDDCMLAVADNLVKDDGRLVIGACRYTLTNLRKAAMVAIAIEWATASTPYYICVCMCGQGGEH